MLAEHARSLVAKRLGRTPTGIVDVRVQTMNAWPARISGLLLLRLVVVASTADSTPHRSQNPEDHAKYHQNDANCPEEAYVEDGGKNEANDSEDDQFGFLQCNGLVTKTSTPRSVPETPRIRSGLRCPDAHQECGPFTANQKGYLTTRQFTRRTPRVFGKARQALALLDCMQGTALGGPSVPTADPTAVQSI